MERTDGANKDTDAFGSGKHGFKETPPYTAATPEWANAVQEEIARVIEGFGVALNPASYTQLFDAITGPGRTAVAQTDAALGVFGVTAKPNQHPSSSSNRWKEIVSAITNQVTSTRVRVLVGDGDAANGTWAITFNARWQCASGDQNWVADNTALDSSLLLASPDGLLQLHTRAAGAGTWTSWARANVLAKDIEATGDLTVDDVATADTVVATSGFYTPGSTGTYNHAPNKLRSTAIPMRPVNGGNDANFDVTPNASGGVVRIPLALPVDSDGGTLKVVCFEAATAPFVLTLRSHTVNFSSGARSSTTIDSATTAGAGGVVIVPLAFTGPVVETDEYWLEVDFPADASTVRGLLWDGWSDAGPRNTL